MALHSESLERKAARHRAVCFALQMSKKEKASESALTNLKPWESYARKLCLTLQTRHSLIVIWLPN